MIPLRRVTPKPGERYLTCVPLVDLDAAAGAWRAQEGISELEDPSVEWVTWDGAKRFTKDMFVARVVGHSMEPIIPDGAYCLFRRVALPSSPERAVLVRHAGVANPETGGRYTVKRYREGKGPSGEKQVVLEPANAAFAPIVITSPGVDDVRVIAEVVEILGTSDDTRVDAARELQERLSASDDAVDRVAGALLRTRTGKPALTLADAQSAAEAAGLDLSRGYLALVRLESDEASGLVRYHVDHSKAPPRAMPVGEMIEALRSHRDVSETAMHEWMKWVQVVWAPTGYRPEATKA